MKASFNAMPVSHDPGPPRVPDPRWHIPRTHAVGPSHPWHFFHLQPNPLASQVLSMSSSFCLTACLASSSWSSPAAPLTSALSRVLPSTSVLFTAKTCRAHRDSDCAFLSSLHWCLHQNYTHNTHLKVIYALIKLFPVPCSAIECTLSRI